MRVEWEVKNAAYNAFNRALKHGLLVRPDSCERCGKKPGVKGTKGIHGHHPDYTRPLYVLWLCTKCHRWYHSGDGRAANRAAAVVSIADLERLEGAA